MIEITVKNKGAIETVKCDAYLLSTFTENEDEGLESATKIEGSMGKGALLMIYITVKEYILKLGKVLTQTEIDSLDSVANNYILTNNKD